MKALSCFLFFYFLVFGIHLNAQPSVTGRARRDHQASISQNNYSITFFGFKALSTEVEGLIKSCKAPAHYNGLFMTPPITIQVIPYSEKLKSVPDLFSILDDRPLVPPPKV